LVERVRAKMGRVVSHPRAIRVTARGGRVTLMGPILAGEVAPLLACASRIHGVHELENRLEVHTDAGDHPALQGGVPRPGSQSERAQEHWPPAVALTAGS